MKTPRRQFLVTGASLGIAGFAAALPSHVLAKEPAESAAGKEEKKDEAKPDEDVTPAEDLMREHGALRRILLIYEEGLRRLHANQDLPPKTLADSAGIVRSFVEDYHEKLEEDHLFPRFRKAGKLVELVDVLLDQHHAGRRLTETTLRLSTAQAMKNAADRKALGESLGQFIRMYAPHAAREDTVLFPALHDVISAHEYDSMGDDFEKKEHELFGADGFEKMVDHIASIEKSLGIYDLAQFTPRE
jgi:hemerythrin-like domain-containing protein